MIIAIRNPHLHKEEKENNHLHAPKPIASANLSSRAVIDMLTL
jgi:hypothetical protein